MAEKSKRWSRAETLYLISAMEQLKIVERSDGRKYKNAELFKTVSEKMKEVRYLNRDVTQVQNKWKLLKQEYNKAKAKSKTSGSDPSNWPFFDDMDRVMGGRPMTTADEYGVDAGFEGGGETANDVSVSDDVSSLKSFEADGSPSSGSTFTGQAEVQRPGSSTDQTDVDRPGSSLAEDVGDAASAPKATNTRPMRKKTPKSGYQRALLSWSDEQKTMMEEMQVREHEWAEQQQQRRDQRERQQQQQRDEQEENFVTRIIEQNARSTERLVGMMFEGLRALLPPAQPGPPPPQYQYPQYNNYPVPHQHPHSQLQQPHSQLQHFPAQHAHQGPAPRPSENPDAESVYTFFQLE